MRYKGVYSSATAYEAGDVVFGPSGNSNAYQCVKACTGMPVISTEYWHMMRKETKETLELIASATSSIPTIDVANDLTTTTAGKVLDARQGKVLKDLIDALTERVAALEPTGNEGE